MADDLKQTGKPDDQRINVGSSGYRAIGYARRPAFVF
jgi:hypothetical protein